MLELRGSRLLDELDVITAEVQKRAGGPEFLFGSSMGGWASAWFAARNPAILFHGMNDDVVPHTISADFVARAALRDVELMIFKRGDHRLNRERERLA